MSIAEKRRRLNESGEFEPSNPLPSCARTDAKTQNRDLQMKYDIAKNEDGPLRRTMKTGVMSGTDSNQPTAAAKDSVNRSTPSSEDYPSIERYPALDERLQNVEKHFAVRYGGCSVLFVFVRLIKELLYISAVSSTISP